VRLVWHLMTDWHCRRAIEVAEQFADGIASAEELAAAREVVRWRDRHTVSYLAHNLAREYIHVGDMRLVSPLWLKDHARGAGGESAEAAIEAQLVMLLRDIGGNPFQTHKVPPAWLAWNDRTVPVIATFIYRDRDFERLPILADALEDAGCDNADLLAHCRGPGPHVRGCWVVDLLLGKS
jgi:hypothetical protein